MKNLFLILVFTFQCVAAFPQFKVHSNGNVSMGLSTGVPLSRFTMSGVGDSTYSFYLRDNRSGIFSQAMGGSGTWLYGGNMSSVVTASGKMFVGVSGNATSSDGIDNNVGRAFGVMGTAGNATSGWNYGVFGRIVGKGNGAAVYGTIYEKENGRKLKDRYAGYFNGKVSVRGNLTVRGIIDGILTCPSLEEYVPLGISHGIPLSDSHSNSGSAAGGIMPAVSENLSTFVPIVGELPEDGLGDYVNRPGLDSTLVAVDYTSMELQYDNKKHYALSVDEVEAVYPDLVYTKDDGTKVINYIEMIPLLVESIKELRAQIVSLQGGNIGSRMMSVPKSDSSVGNGGTSGVGGTVSSSVASLLQNDPNPFVDATAVRMFIPETVTDAMLCVYDMSGKQIRRTEIHDRGEVTVSVTAEGLTAGMYLYSLIADGKLVNTRKMILTK